MYNSNQLIPPAEKPVDIQQLQQSEQLQLQQSAQIQQTVTALTDSRFPFIKNPLCPKCANENVTVRYPKNNGKEIQLSHLEYLKCKCLNCHYTFPMKPAQFDETIKLPSAAIFGGSDSDKDETSPEIGIGTGTETDLEPHPFESDSAYTEALINSAMGCGLVAPVKTPPDKRIEEEVADIQEPDSINQAKNLGLVTGFFTDGIIKEVITIQKGEE